MRSSKHSFMLKFVLLTLLVGSVPCLPTKREANDDKQEVDVTDSGERAEVQNRESSRSGWATPEVPALFDAQDRKEKHNRNRRRKSTSDYGRKSYIVLSTSFGKEVGEDNKKDKSQALMLLDREAEASGAKKTAVETQLWQYIGILISFAIVLAACAWPRRSYKWWQCCRDGYQPEDGEGVPILNEKKQCSTAASVFEAFRSFNVAESWEDHEDQSKPDTHDHPGRNRMDQCKTEEDTYKITEPLAQYNDLELRGVTESYQEQLESAIEDVVEHISESLSRKRRMSEINLEEIRTLIRNNQRSDASEHILESVLDGDIGNCRMFWNVLFELQIQPQYLMKLLAQDVEIDVKRRHRCHLRNQNVKVKLPKPRLISDIYIEPTITVIPGEHGNLTGEPDTHIREVKHHELFEQSNRDSDMSKISVVYGAVGTGKTTMIQKLIYDWATGEIYKEFSFVLHFKIQKLNEIKCNITLSRLIVDTYPYLENYLDHLWNDPKRLLFIFDDLDQLYLSLTLSDTGRNSDPRYRCTDTESEHLVCDIVRCLLQGDILRGCSVLITNRVCNLELLHHIAADSTFQVMGFTYEKAKEYFRRYLRNGQNANEIVEFIEQNDLLWNMCRDPLFCVILASSLESFQAEGEEQKSNLVISHTKVLSEYVTHLLGKCGYDGNTNRKLLRVVGELADKGIGQNALSLEGEALRDLDSCPPVFISAFMYQDPAKQSGGVTYEFRHPVLKDFLAALTNVLNAPISRLTRNLDERFADVEGRFITFSIFLVGLSCRKSTDRLELELHTFPIEVTSCISEWFRERVTRRLKDMDKDRTQKMFLCLLYCLFEFGDNEITKEVLNSITTIKLNHLQLKSPDRIVLSRTLISPEVIQELDLSSCFAQTEEIWKLQPLLHRCVILRLNQNNLQDSGVKRLFHVLKKSKIKTLSLKSNNLTDNCLESVFVALTTNPTLLQLNLSNTSQDGKQANRFTDEKLQYHRERFAQQKEIKWLRIKYFGQEFARSLTQSNSLTLITD